MQRLLLSPRVASVLAALALSLARIGSASATTPSHTVYLNFSDGTEAIRLGELDDATLDISQLCDNSAFRWEGASDCPDRSSCRDGIVELVRQHWSDFDLQIVVERPEGDYTMMVIGPASEGCQFGLLGLAPIDCGNASDRSVGFAFECGRSMVECAAIISHELGHTFGLDHTSDEDDLMTTGPLGVSTPGFVDRDVPLVMPECHTTAQNSYRELQSTLGNRSASDPSADEGRPNERGCQLGPSTPGGGLWLALALLAGARFRRRNARN